MHAEKNSNIICNIYHEYNYVIVLKMCHTSQTVELFKMHCTRSEW